MTESVQATAAADDHSPGALVISLDLELHWGVLDKCSADGPYAKNLHGARTVIPRMLELFEEFEVAATWATVGFLFARSAQEVEEFSPLQRPRYRKMELSPYEVPVGVDEAADPLHLGASLVRSIRETPRQEVATHTFSHYLCGEKGQGREEFRADLAAAKAIAARHQVDLRSIVFPRNQHNPAYDEVLEELGIRAYRGNPRSRLWRFDNAEESARIWMRAGRFLDAYLGGSGGAFDWNEVRQTGGLSDVRASTVLRPFSPHLRLLEPLRLRRIRRSLRFAARSRRILHIWWHPHNFGIHQEQNLRFLRGILRDFATCRERYGMESLSMSEVDSRVRSASDVGAKSPSEKSSAPSPALRGMVGS